MDAKAWENLGRVEGAQNANSIQHYSLIDNQPIDGVQYYRLKQVDINGSFTYSNIVPVKFNGDVLTETISIVPNPANAIVNVVLSDDADASLTVFNSLGQSVLNFNAQSSKVISFDISALNNGVYTLQLIQNGTVSNSKLIKN